MIPETLIGTWELVTGILYKNGEEDYRYPEGTDALLVYNLAGKISAHLQFPEEKCCECEDHDQDLMGACLCLDCSDEAAPDKESYLGYFGRYSVDENNILVHDVHGSSRASLVGTQEKRVFSFSGKQLQLSTLTWNQGEDEYQAVITWRRQDLLESNE